MKYYLLFLLIFIAGCAQANITGEAVLDEPILEGPFVVTKVVDGDTLDLDTGERIRLSGINTPETGECFYQEAKDMLSLLTRDKEVYVERDKSDAGKYGRLLRYVYVDDVLVNKVLVQGGYARVYDKYSYDTKRYDELKNVEVLAQQADLGVWSCVDAFAHCLYVGSKNSEVYHDLDCKFAKKIKIENKVCYMNEEDVAHLRKSKC